MILKRCRLYYLQLGRLHRRWEVRCTLLLVPSYGSEVRLKTELPPSICNGSNVLIFYCKPFSCLGMFDFCVDSHPWVIFPSKNDTATIISDVFIALVNVPLSVWALSANLALIIAIIKTPALRFRSNVLVCNLATADCLTGLITQPCFTIWRLALHYVDCQRLTTIWKVLMISGAGICVSYVMLIPISWDRLHALIRPAQYRAVAKRTKGTRSPIRLAI